MAGEVRFHLKNANAPRSQIECIYRFDGQVMRMCIGESIESHKWDKSKQRMKRNYTETSFINNILDTMSKKIREIYLQAKSDEKTITPEYIRTTYKNLQNPRKKASFIGCFEEYTANAETKQSYRTIQKYRTTLRHVQEFITYTGFKLTFETASQEFYDQFTAYLRTSGNLTDNSVGKYVEVLKTFMRYALHRKLHTNMDFALWKADKIPSSEPALTLQEVHALTNLDLSANARLERVRDVFIFAVHTALRFSDVEQLKEEHFQQNEIRFTSIKTRKRQIIPLVGLAKVLIEKYDSVLPVISSQKMNKYIKEVAKLAGLERSCELVHQKGNERITETKPLYELVTMHTARRTYVTLAREHGMRDEIVMKITDHSSAKMLGTYNKILDSTVKRDFEQFAAILQPNSKEQNNS